MARIRTALQVLALTAGSVAIACGDGEKQLSTAAPNPGATGGAGTNTGGTATTHVGGSATSATNSGGTTPLSTATGGSAFGGSGTATSTQTGGAGAGGGGTGGASSTAGSGTGGLSAPASSGGGNSTTGGSSMLQTSLGGTSPLDTSSGGTTTSETIATGGASTVGGESGIGGASTSQTGGAPATGGAATGGAATGGTSALSCIASYVAPTDNQALANADDLNGNCSDGIQYNIVVATNAPDATPATLSLALGSGDTTQIAATQVASAVARFNNVTLPASGQVTLTASIAGASCSATETLTLSCAGAPGCTITSPTITATHPALNGVAAAQQGDRVSSVGAPYQVAFEVSTDVQDGQPVVLTVDGSTNYQTTASAGKARFGGVLMAPDGTHAAQATCTARSGLSSSTSLLTFPVDTTSPELVPQKGTGAGGATLSTLSNSDHYEYTDDADSADGLQIRFCGATNSADAVDVSAGNPNVNNFCVKRGNNAPACAPVTSANSSAAGNFACVNIDCPGEGPFSIDLSMSDAAGNPTTISRTGITCASTSPSVTFIDPVSDSGQFADVARRILAADNNNPQTVRKDKNPSKSGAQYDVVACTSAPAGSTAILYTGYMGQTLNQTATTTVTTESSTAPICPSGNLITFSSSVVTLPESLTNASFNISTPTELKVSVTDPNLATGSAVADVWVDSVSPSLTLVSPNPFCGEYFNTSGTGSTAAAVNMKFGSSIPVTVSVAGSSGTQTFSSSNVAFSQVTVGVELPRGTDTVSARAEKPSSNYGSYPACDVTVGDTPPPTVSWQTPVNSSLLTAAGNSGTNKIPDNSASSGWQGTLKVCTDVDVAANPGATVSFTATMGTVITALGSTNLVTDGTCLDGKTSSATVNDVTVPEGDNVILTAITSEIAGNAGTASITVPVASAPPGQVAITAVDITDRRGTSFTPRWTAASGNVAGYKVRVSRTPIVSQPDFDGAYDIPYTGGGSCLSGGCSVLVDKCVRDLNTGNVFNCYIENDYYFAVAPVDGVGNLGAFSATTTATRATLKRSVLASPLPGQRFGRVIDGSGDLNGDSFADVVVTHGEGKDVYIYFGSATGLVTPPLDIQGGAQYFGYAAAIVGDVNDDGLVDLAIGSPNEGDGVVYVYYGRTTWTVPTLPDVLIRVDSASAPPQGDPKFGYSAFGWAISRIGDFDGNGVDDFVLGTPYYGGSDGHLAIVLGKAGGLSSQITLPSGFGTDAVEILGSAGSMLGYSTLGIGHFYGNAKNTALVASAIGIGAGTGALLAFQGAENLPKSLDVSTRAAYATGPAGAFFGEEGLFLLGDIGPSGQLAIGVPVPRINPPGQVSLLSGSSLAGPFAQQVTVNSSLSGSAKDFGELVFGSAYSGVDPDASSLIGSNRADVVIGTKTGGVPRILIVDGTTISFPSSAAAETLAQVSVDLPTPWTDFANYSSVIADLNRDGYADIAIGQTDYTSKPTDGSVVVYY